MFEDVKKAMSVANKRHYQGRILEKDGKTHSIDTTMSYNTVSMVVPAISHYWITKIEESINKKLTIKEYVTLSKKLDKVITEQLEMDYIKSIVEYPMVISNSFCVSKSKKLSGIFHKNIIKTKEMQDASTIYKLVDGNIVLRNNYEDNFDEYYVFTDRKYNAKSYKVNIGVKHSVDNELKFCDE